MDHHRTAFLLATALLVGSTVLAQEPSDDFRRLDKNKDGRLTIDEFSDPLFSKIDTDKDGSISVEEDQKLVHGRSFSLLEFSDLIQASFNLPYAATYNYNQRLHLY